jgi:uncharacterized RDD family membrane protein YckC
LPSTVTCPQCSSVNDAGAKYCTSCGSSLYEAVIEDPVCPACKTEYPAGINFCTKDGSRLISRADMVPRCPICGTVYMDGGNFCQIDGGKIALPGASPHTADHGVVFYSRASLSSRFLAALLDGVITLGLAIPALTCYLVAIGQSYADDSSSTGFFLLGLLFYIIPLVYSLIKDSLGNGQSWGKRPFSLMVVNLENNMPCSTGKSAGRNFISGLISIIPFVGWLIEPLMVLITIDGRKLGDMAADTQVIEVQQYT